MNNKKKFVYPIENALLAFEHMPSDILPIDRLTLPISPGFDFLEVLLDSLAKYFDAVNGKIIST